MGHRILHLAKSTGGSRDARVLRARRDYKLASQELSSISLNIQGSFPFFSSFIFLYLCLIINYIMILSYPKEKNLVRRKLLYPRLIILFIDVVLLKIRVFYLPFRYNECTSKVHNCDNANAFCITFLSDINKCTTNVHICDANAFCSNSEGSYNCTCSPGYTGNGTSCTGIYIVCLLLKTKLTKPLMPVWIFMLEVFGRDRDLHSSTFGCVTLMQTVCMRKE